MKPHTTFAAVVLAALSFAAANTVFAHPGMGAGMGPGMGPVSYTHLTLPTNREV